VSIVCGDIPEGGTRLLTVVKKALSSADSDTLRSLLFWLALTVVGMVIWCVSARLRTR